MPGFDRTGPQGMGPMTGGARGLCNSANVGYRSRVGRGMGLRRGFRGGDYGQGRGMRRNFGRGVAYDDPYPADDIVEMDMLKAEAEAVKNDLDMINRRITELEKKSS